MELQSKFIEGTNEQYSIRNDGVIISHYTLSGHVCTMRDKVISQRKLSSQKYITFVSTIYVIGIQRDVRVESLLYKYFNIQYCRDCSSCVENSKRKYYCTTCDKIHTSVKNNRWRDNNIDKVKKAYLANGLKKRTEITRHYVSTNLNMSVKDVSDELYKAAKTNLILKRKIKQLKIEQNGKT
jgi:hypothetical protein